MKVAIISGGTGNDALVKGLKNIYKNIDIKVITNAYDNGKSTGVCRAVTDTLGVSDIRKNHTRMYKAMCPNPDERLLEFYDKRYNFTKGREVEEICDYLDSWNLGNLKKYCVNFFKNKKAYKYEYKDFSVANIIYAQMYKELGYEATNKYFCDLLGLEDFVILNSFDNVYIQAVTESGKVIADEGDIVELKNPDDKIIKLNYVGTKSATKYGLNDLAIKAIQDADLIIISTGTFWSSIYPTLEYRNFYKYVNSSTAKKIWVMNNSEDKDAYGVTSNDFIEKFEKLGLDLTPFTILENIDAIDSLKMPNDNYNIVLRHMENNNGKHNGDLYARAILEIYYGLQHATIDKLVLDFDDTIWARNYKQSEILNNYSVDNIKLLNDVFKDRACIISGNTIGSIRNKLYGVYGTDLSGFNVDIWADANTTLYKHDKLYSAIDTLALPSNLDKVLEYTERKFNIEFDYVNKFNYKIKYLTELERNLLVCVLNNAFESFGLDAIAIKAGTTTVDIVNKYNTKDKVFYAADLGKYKTLYIGDEVDSGNDKSISEKCTYKIHTSGVEETNAVLKLLKDLV